MKVSILIVSKNRKEDLDFTLNVLAKILDFSIHEVLVFLDGCIDGSEVLKHKYKWVVWSISQITIGASAARHYLYPKAKGEYLIGLDDDAHPLQTNFIYLIKTLFEEYPNVGILAFQEIKGIFNSDEEALAKFEVKEEEYYCSDFIGCGFAIRKEVYNTTNGFPVWIDIYGEESCVAMEVLSKGFDIMYSNKIKVNHRVDKEARIRSGMNYFRFGKQLKNVTYYYLVYYRYPFLKISKLYLHNLRKYALKDEKCFKIFINVIFEVVLNFPKVLKYRKPIDRTIIKKINQLSPIKY